MAVFTFDAAFYDWSQFSSITGIPVNQGGPDNDLLDETVSFPNGATFTIATGADDTVVNITDDDGVPTGGTGNQFSDGAVDLNASGTTAGPNNQVLTSGVTIGNATGGTDTYAAGTIVEVEFGFIVEDPDGNEYTMYVLRFGSDGTNPATGQNVGIMFTGAYPPQGVPLTITGAVPGDLQSIDIDAVPCFTPGSMVQTSAGPKPVESIQAGDLVLTKDRGARPVAWVGHRKVPAAELAITPSLRPVTIEAGALGPNTPNRDMTVSPEHRMLVTNDQVSVLFGVEDALVAARSMVNGDTIRITQPEDGVEYIHLMFDRHEIIFVDGTETESFFPGDYGIKGLDDGPRAELIGLFPELGLKGTRFGKLARRSLRKAEAELVL